MNPVLLFLLFFFSFILFSVTGFLIVRMIFINVWDYHLPNESMSISGSILAVLAIFVSVPLSFIIIFLWTNYNETIEKLQIQTNQLLVMYNTIKLLKNKVLLNAMNEYIHNKIIFNKFQEILYQYQDDSVLYNQIVLMSNNIVDNQFTINNHVNVEVWSVIFIGVLALIIGTFFVKSPFLLHLYLIISVSGVLGSLVFLIYYYNTIDCYTCIKDQLRNELIEKIK